MQAQPDAQGNAREYPVAAVGRQERAQDLERSHRTGHDPQQEQRRRQLRRRFAPQRDVEERFSESQHRSFSHNPGFKLYTRNESMPDAIWVDHREGVRALARSSNRRR